MTAEQFILHMRRPYCFPKMGKFLYSRMLSDDALFRPSDVNTERRTAAASFYFQSAIDQAAAKVI